MKHPRFASAAFFALLLQFGPLQVAARGDMGSVGDYMSRMLQNMHFERPPFMEMSQLFLDDYLKDLDPDRVFFLQSDVDKFNEEYGKTLSARLLRHTAPEAAEAIYQVYRERVKARVEQTRKLVAENKFDFTGTETIPRSRKDMPWPKNEADAAKIWGLQVKELVLTEVLRRETVAKRAKEQGKPDPSVTDKTPAQMVGIRNERLLHRVMEDTTSHDIAAQFLSVVARAFDPHSDYMAVKEAGRFKETLRNELVGIGAQLLSAEEGGTKITGIMVDGPADRQGQLKLDDSIIAVDPDGSDGPKAMVDVMFMDSDKVVDLIRGDQGSKVMLKVIPAGMPTETSLIEITREKVEVKASLASAQIIRQQGKDGDDLKLGIITLPSFYVDFDGSKAGCSEDVEKLLVRLNREEVDGLILDLRMNGGGSLGEVQRMTGLFIGSGPVTQVKDTLGRIQVLESPLREPLYTGPLIVMTDKASASASEILAGALQDVNRAVIVGQSSTFGKGTVQKTVDIASNMPFFSARDKAGTLKLTFQKFYRPSGSSTQNRGVVPDIILPDSTDAFEYGEEFLPHSLKHDFIRQAAGLKPMDRNLLSVPRLAELSHARVEESKDFGYLKNEIAKAKKLIKENRVSLNLAEREKELQESEVERKEIRAEREARFAEVQKKDLETMKFYDLTLEDVDADRPLVETDPTKQDGRYMRRAPVESSAGGPALVWPSGLDAQKREGLLILADMVELSRNNRVAGLTGKEKEEIR